jgi:hypothetical protein
MEDPQARKFHQMVGAVIGVSPDQPVNCSVYKVPIEFSIDVVADNILKTSIGDEPKFGSSVSVKVARPTGDNALDLGVDLTPNSPDNRVTCDASKSFNLFRNRNTQSRHGQITPRPNAIALDHCGVQQEFDRGCRRCVPVSHCVSDRQYSLLTVEGLSDDAREEA